MKMIYISNQRLPTEKAYGIQITKMCEAFGDLKLEVVLVAPYRISRIKNNLFEYYGVRSNFKFKNIFSPDFYLPGRLNWVAFQIKNFISAVILTIYVLVNKSDIIYSRDELPLYLLSFFKKNIFFEIHKFSGRKKIFYRRFKKLNLKIIVISKGNRKELFKIGFKENNMIVASDGVDLDKFSNFEPDDKSAIRKRLNLPQNKRIIGYVGQLKTMGMEKGIGTLIKAFKMINLQSKDLMLVIVGGSEEDLGEYESSEDILFLGHKPYNLIPHYLKAFDVLTMPFPYNQHYAFYMSPLKLFEYMASKRPIVATDLPATREILNENNAVLVKADSAQSLFEGIKKLLEDEYLAKKLSEQAFQNVQNYTWSKRSKRILEFIK
ncbi:MAG: group 1 glycosyl transferase [Parcubacteria group bacterium Gr01-1014_2]|nr:MAG: group 1 glycosyl transferase [Parcubacteria group bacterium Gr01-1014_2]